MSGLLKRIAEFIVFRNVFIAFAAVCLVAESRFLSGSAWDHVDALIAFTFFATFLVYNFHSFSNDSDNEFSVRQIFKDFINPVISLEQKICVVIGIVGTLISFLFLEARLKLILLPLCIVTLAYSLPIFRIENRLRSLRDIIYVKIFTVAVVWAAATTIIPYMNDAENNSFGFLSLLFLERFLFIYAITIPFEIRDRQGELAIGNKTIPLVYGVAKSKTLGYFVLLLYCIIVFAREWKYGHFGHESRMHFVALFISAISAVVLIFKTNDNRNTWFYKFLIDGTMIEQFFLLILVYHLC